LFTKVAPQVSAVLQESHPFSEGKERKQVKEQNKPKKMKDKEQKGKGQEIKRKEKDKK